MRSVDNRAVREAQVEGLLEVRAKRDPQRCRAALEEPACGGGIARREPGGARDRGGSRARGERGRDLGGARSGSSPLATYRQCGRLSGVYAAAYRDDEAFAALVRDVTRLRGGDRASPPPARCEAGSGRPRSGRAESSPPAFADLGFDVDIGALFQTPGEAASEAWTTTCTWWECPPRRALTEPWCPSSSRLCARAEARRWWSSAAA